MNEINNTYTLNKFNCSIKQTYLFAYVPYCQRTCKIAIKMEMIDQSVVIENDCFNTIKQTNEMKKKAPVNFSFLFDRIYF